MSSRCTQGTRRLFLSAALACSMQRGKKKGGGGGGGLYFVWVGWGAVGWVGGWGWKTSFPPLGRGLHVHKWGAAFLSLSSSLSFSLLLARALHIYLAYFSMF